MAIGFVASLGFGKVLDLVMASLIEEESVTFYKIFDWWTLWILLIILIISLFASWITIRKMLLRTPGDLIYNR